MKNTICPSRANIPNGGGEVVADQETNTRVISRYNLFSLYLPALILALGLGIATPALPVFAKSFDISFGTASLVIVAHAVGSAAATLPMGFLIDRIGRRKILLGGPILTAISSFLIVIAQSFPELLLYRFLAGWATQMWTIGRLAIISDTGGTAQRGRQITGMSGMDGVGRLLGPAVGGFVAAVFGVRVPFLLYGILALVAVVPSFKLLRETAPLLTEGSSRVQTKKAVSSSNALKALLVYPIMMLFLARATESLARGVLFGGTINFYTVYAYDVGPAVIGVLGTAAAIIGIPITLSAGYLMDRFGRKATLVPGFALLGVGHIIMAVIAYLGLSFATYVPFFLFLFASQSLTGGNMQTLGSDMAPPDARGRFFGVYNLISQVGTTLSPVMFALLAAVLSYAASFSFASAMALITALVLATQIKETLIRETPASVPVVAKT